MENSENLYIKTKTVVEGKSCSISALVQGYKHFHPDIKIEIILNLIFKEAEALNIHFYTDGWCSLPDLDKLIRNLFVVPVNGSKRFRRGYRPVYSEYFKKKENTVPCFVVTYSHCFFVEDKGSIYLSEVDVSAPVAAMWKVAGTAYK